MKKISLKIITLILLFTLASCSSLSGKKHDRFEGSRALAQVKEDVQNLAPLADCVALVSWNSGKKITKQLTLEGSKLAINGTINHSKDQYSIGVTVENYHFEFQENPTGLYPEIEKVKSDSPLAIKSFSADWNKRENKEEGYFNLSVDGLNSKKDTVRLTLECSQKFN